MGDARRILVVDDELGPREALRMILKSKYQVMTAANGPDALQMIDKIPPDIVLLDIKMRDMSGIEVLKAIKDTDASIEVIMMTAYASLQTAREAISHGASEYLIKPFSKKEVEEAIAKAAARRAERSVVHQELRTLLAQLRGLAQPATPAGFAHLATVLTPVQRLFGATTALLHLRATATDPWRVAVDLNVPPGARHAFDAPAWQAQLTQTLATAQPRLLAGISDPATALPPELDALGYTQALLCPLSLAPTGAGVLVWLTTAQQLWPADAHALAQTVADLLALALTTQQRAQAAQQAAALQAQRAAQLAIWRAISQVILGELELPATLQALGTQLQDGLGYAGFHVWLTTPPAGQFRPAYGQGPNPGWQPTDSTPLPSTLQVISGPDAQVILAPILLAERPVGILKLVRTASQEPLTPAELELVRLLLDAIALAVHNARLYGEIATTKRFLDQLIQGAGDAILTVDAADRITLWNPSAAHIFGAPAAAMLGQPIQSLVPDERWAVWRAAVAQGGASLQVDTPLSLDMAPPRDVLLTISPLRSPEGTLTGLSLICKDVTAERQLHEQMMQAEKLRVVGEMAAGMAHNFNNILTTILTRAELLQQQLDARDMVQRNLTLIAQAATDGAAIVRRLQQLARGNTATERRALDLSALVQEVVETTQPVWREQTTRQGRAVALALELASVPPVWGRPVELREVLINLIFNAVEAMPQGGQLTLRTWAQAGQVCVAVSDTGMGMTAEVQQRLFDPFFTTKGARGTGLGLTMSQALIKGHQGTLTVQSTPGCGATFVITLPCASESTDVQVSQVVA
jgi:PAS domain S-box-containing protein